MNNIKMNDTQENILLMNNTSLGINESVNPANPTSTTLMTYRLFILRYGFIIICISIFIIVSTSAFVYMVCVFSKKEGSKYSSQGSGLSPVSAGGSSNASSVKAKKKKKDKHKKKLKPAKNSNDSSSGSSVAQDSVLFKTKTISQLQKLGKKKKKVLIPVVSSTDSDSDDDGNDTNQLKVKQKLIPKVSKIVSSKSVIKQLKNVAEESSADSSEDSSETVITAKQKSSGGKSIAALVQSSS